MNSITQSIKATLFAYNLLAIYKIRKNIPFSKVSLNMLQRNQDLSGLIINL